MVGILSSIAGVVIVLGILVFVHEWGHFLAARMFGVRVDIFSFGFGTRLWGWRHGTTDYRISALPLGGYVKMAGDNPVDERTGAPDEFLSKPRWQRVVIALAGPTVNMALAVILTIGLFMVPMSQPIYVARPAVVAGVFKDSPAEKAGVQPGDRIAEIGGAKNPEWEDVLFELLLGTPGSQVSMVIDRQGQLVPITLTSRPARGARDEFALVGYPQEPVIVDSVSPGLPAARVGVRPDDEIVEANGQPVNSPFQLAAEIQESAGRPLECAVERGGRRLHLEIRPTYGDPGDGAGKRWEIGVGFRQATISRAHPFPESVGRGVVYNVRLTRQIVFVLGELIQSKVSIKQLVGPVGIAKPAGQALRRGPVDMLMLMALLSLNLGILNLLPIPILDGGHILMLAIEGTMRRDLSIAVKERFVQVGFVFLLLIFVIVMYNDVLRLLPSH